MVDRRKVAVVAAVITVSAVVLVFDLATAYRSVGIWRPVVGLALGFPIGLLVHKEFLRSDRH